MEALAGESAHATEEQGAFESAGMRMPTQPMTAEGKAANADMEQREASEARASEEKAYDKQTKGKYSDIYGGIDSSDDEIQQRRTADQRRLDAEDQTKGTASGFGMMEMFRAMMESQAK